jgi:hypothetical protein
MMPLNKNTGQTSNVQKTRNFEEAKPLKAFPRDHHHLGEFY